MGDKIKVAVFVVFIIFITMNLWAWRIATERSRRLAMKMGELESILSSLMDILAQEREPRNSCSSADGVGTVDKLLDVIDSM